MSDLSDSDSDGNGFNGYSSDGYDYDSGYHYGLADKYQEDYHLQRNPRIQCRCNLFLAIAKKSIEDVRKAFEIYRGMGFEHDAFTHAINCQRLDVLKYLLSQGVKINEVKTPLTPLMTAMFKGNVEITTFLLDNGATVPQKERLDLILVAVDLGHLKILELLAERGYDMQSKELIEEAASNGYLDMVKFLFERGPDTYDALISATEHGHLEVVKFLLENRKNTKEELNSLLSIAAMYHCNKIAAYLIDVGAEVNYDKCFPLRFSILTRDIELGQLVIARGSDTSLVPFEALLRFLTEPFVRSLPEDVVSKIQIAHPKFTPPPRPFSLEC